MQEISLNILDVAQNSISAQATLVKITVDQQGNWLQITIQDDGCGMSQEQIQQVCDPFYTTRTTRRVGLGVPLFKMASEMAGGSFHIQSQPGEGTLVSASFDLDNIDCMPLGDLEDTICTLVTMSGDVDILYRRIINQQSFELDTKQLREILGDLPLNTPEVALFIRDYLRENAPCGSEDE